jgi:cytochrome c biogenesis protein CcmG/thiol:disulfide interchange protein DsbE
MARVRAGSPMAIALVSAVLVALVAALVLSIVLDGDDDTAAGDVVRLTLAPEDGGPTITAPPLTTVGEPAPDFTYEQLDGEEVDFDDFRDGRPALVNFFSETCVPCVTEMPDIEDAHQEFGDEVAFLGLAYPDTVEQARELIDRTGVTYEAGRDPQADAFAAFDGNVFPTTVFIAADGTITSVYQRRVHPPELHDELEALVA